jgi:hypothetical protein
MRNNSCRSAERKAKLAIRDIANAETFSDATRLRTLARLAAVLNGHILEIESRRPAPPKNDPPKFRLLYE